MPLDADQLAAATAALEQGASLREAARVAGAHHEQVRRAIASHPGLAKSVKRAQRHSEKLARRRVRERDRRAAAAAGFETQTSNEAPERGRYDHRTPSDPGIGSTRGGASGHKRHRDPERGRVLTKVMRELNGGRVAVDGAGRIAPVEWLTSHDISRGAVEVRLRDDAGIELDYRCVPREVARELVEQHDYEVL
jgi:hypothetical protein